MIGQLYIVVYHTCGVTEKYGMFLQQCKSIIEDCVPFKTVSLGPRDPDFITPLMKSLLKTRNKYRHSGHIQQAIMCYLIKLIDLLRKKEVPV